MRVVVDTNVFITGDSDLIALNPFRGIPIITPAAFVHANAPPPSSSNE
ncbi:MAG: hypothetical protein ACREF3_02430 [Acetobacteraceae bacterium]